MIQRFIRPSNALLAGYSFLKSSITGIPTSYGLPVTISAELTNYCNLNCPECSSGSGLMKRDRGFMHTDLFNKILSELGPYLYNINLFFQGEPMLHPKFFSFLQNGLINNSVVSTNGHFLSVENSEMIVKSELGKLIISLDGTDQESYSAYRINGKINTVFDGIRNMSVAKMKFNSKIKIEIQFLVNRLNENQIPAVKALAKRLKVSLRLKSMQVIDNRDIESWLPVNERFRRYKKINGKYVIKSSLPDRCARLWFNPVITWDGKVLPCCFDKDAEYVMGDLNHETFREIWDSPKYKIFRKSMLSGRHMIDICRNCTSGIGGVKT
jgi:radical SAM protein with 4Fe4S-binding SPASM domain